MKVLAFNPGSNSLKYQFIEALPNVWGAKMLAGTIEPIENQAEGAAEILTKLEAGEFKPAHVRVIGDLDMIACRVVHGASRFREPARVDETTIQEIEALDDLAPLHNAQSVGILRTCIQHAPAGLPIVAVFDSAFHATLPEVAWRYAIDYDLAEKHGIRRYGFHGISHRYLMLRYAELAETPLEDVNIITLHLEGGSSAAAIRGGKSIDTSMGFTPLEGLMMGTRCGDLDAALVGYLARKEDVDVKTVDHWLNKKSGLLGVSGHSQDTRVLRKNTDERSHLALEMFAYRVRKYIGAYLAAMGGATAVVFGGGISENSPAIRARICAHLEALGLDFDEAKNRVVVDREGCITHPGSRLQAWVIPTEEGLMMAREAVTRFPSDAPREDKPSTARPAAP